MYLQATECQIKAQVILAALTSFRVGGPAEWYAAPRNLDQLKASFEYAQRRDLAITMLGAGSNLLISDRGIPGLVVSTRHLRHSEFNPQTGTVTVAAGEPLPRLAWQAAARGWQGLEWAVGIPGSVGGAVVMNAGAHKTCIGDMLVNAQVLLPSGQIETLSLEELGYSYRTSLLQGSDRLVTQATLQLQPGFDSSLVMATTRAHLEQRKTSQPYHLPSCGSVFRNPSPYTAGWLIEQSGLKGYQVGAAQIAQRHANFILNCGGAKANDIFSLINHVQQQVQQNWSVWLHPEVRMLGEFQPIGY
jgi:UDP-N-acetylmuramate dehydrogenase